MRIRSGIIIAGLLACLVSAGPAVVSAPAHQETIRVGGTGAALGPLRKLSASFKDRAGGVTVEIAPSMGSSGGIRAVAEGALDIGLSSRRLTEDERDQGLTAREFAKTPFVLAAGLHAHAAGMTLTEVVRIYRGETSAWPDGERIRIVLRPASDTDTSIIRSISPGLAAALDGALKREGMLVGLTDQENTELLEKTPGAIGFTSLSQLVTEQPRIKALALDGVMPAENGAVNRQYPHRKPLYLVTKERPSKAVSRFLFFIGSPEGMRVLESAGCIPADIHRP